ncbi:RsmB/NOP family class I SAM-dependent RNA methyltransferase [Sinorhizobium sp. BG8]|uniref:RsmB/NOP family class I SAM-dependent RNA methyltransferase n=1 Tax=Sinorhizobium sp. BG8 TaxID=2613773 RepID=UPI00193C98BF|nr:RsmB/NOP family class I SAM-dependent RNA methyltransferase [Sinorhizobium sp. BG8]QRM53621.1 MFS transporter [Sinorhizobium sp. BG8]
MKSAKAKSGSHPKQKSRGSRSESTGASAGPEEKQGLRSRQTAAKILGAVIDRKTPLDGMLDAEHGNAAYAALSEADRALVRAIINTALRHLPRIEAILNSLVETPLPEGARALHHVLAVAAAQILYLDVPDHSAVDIAVDQAKADPRNRRFANLVNAVLRRLAREKANHLSAVQSIPAIPSWFFDRLVDVYGREHALRISEAQLVPAPIDLTVKSDPEQWAARLGGSVLPTGTVRLSAFSGTVPSLEGFAEGEWWVQDAAASIPAKLFGNVEGQSVADLCAAPGGKTAQLVLAGAKVTALDQSASRLRRLVGNLDRLRLQASTIEANAGNFRPEFPFDAVLLDAPCSSTGTIRRHPDVLWTKGPQDIAKLAEVQEKLLRHAMGMVKPGGKLVFSNCSLDPLEGEEVTKHVLASQPEWTIEPVDAKNWQGLEQAITALGEIRTTPAMFPAHDSAAGGMDGFYAVVLRRLGTSS